MKIRLIASDIDGTLLPFHGQISPATREAIARCRAAGILFCVASGRWFPMARTVGMALGLSEDQPMLTANGCQIVTLAGETLLETVMRPEDARRAYEIICDEPVQILSMCRANMYFFGECESSPMKKGDYGTFNGEHYINHGNDRALLEKEGLARPYKIEVYAQDAARLSAIRARLEGAGLMVSSSYPTNLEIMSPGTGKGAAVTRLARGLGISPEECMAFGDNTNDLDMLLAVGWPVAVGNAVDELKAAARVVAPNCEDDGVARIIGEYALGAM